jgi:hypothetical protein
MGGIVAVRREGQGVGYPIAGLALNLFSLLIANFWLGLFDAVKTAIGGRKEPPMVAW